MATQQNVSIYAKAIQAQLSGIISPVPVYANFNRNFATEPKFVTWQLKNVHQPVYTGIYQANKGIDRPAFDIDVYTTYMADGFDIANTILQSLHGYSGLFGGSTYGFQISKADVVWDHHAYDNTVGLHSIYMNCTLDIPT
jgi:hypothetical protein